MDISTKVTTVNIYGVQGRRCYGGIVSDQRQQPRGLSAAPRAGVGRVAVELEAMAAVPAAGAKHGHMHALISDVLSLFNISP